MKDITYFITIAKVFDLAKRRIFRYSNKTKIIKLNKNWFHVDLLWTSGNNTNIAINNIIAVYMNRANQIDTDTLCNLFGAQRVSRITKIYVLNKYNRKEALVQIKYFKHKSFKITDKELSNILNRPTQRVVDLFCERYGYIKLIQEVGKNDISFPHTVLIKRMINYYLVVKNYKTF